MAHLFFPCARREIRLIFRRHSRYSCAELDDYIRVSHCRLRFSAASRVWESKVPPGDVDTPNTVRHGAAVRPRHRAVEDKRVSRWLCDLMIGLDHRLTDGTAATNASRERDPWISLLIVSRCRENDFDCSLLDLKFRTQIQDLLTFYYVLLLRMR